MPANEQVSQRDMRLRSREIMDAVEAGQAFTVTRGGHAIGELVPLRPARAFVSRDRFVEVLSGSAGIDAAGFRADLDASLDQFSSARHAD